MTVASAANKVTLNGNGATTSWPFSFRIFDSSDLEIYKTDTSGVQTEITSNFSVVVNGESGGTVTYPSTGSPLASGETITIIRVTVRAQSVDFTSQGAFLPQNHEDADDRAMMILQELDEKIDRAFKLPTSDTSGTATELTTDVTGSAGGVLYIQSGVLKLSDSANIDDLETLAGISGDITTVAANDANVTTVADNLNGTDTIGTVAGSIANVDAVGSNISNVLAVDSNSANINAAVANATNINTVAGISADVTTVSGISADVTAVAADAADIGVVSSNIADVSTVAGISANVTTVATDTAAINTVASDLTGVDDIGTVATNISNVNAVGSNISDITNAVSQAAAGVQRNTYTGDSSTVTFVLPATPWDADVVFAYLDGVNQDNSEWSVSGSDITFNTAPGTGVNIELVVLTAGTVTAAQASASNAAASLAAFQSVFLGAQASDPSVDLNGDAVTAGDWYFNSSTNRTRIYTGSVWADAVSGLTAAANETITGAWDFASAPSVNSIYGDIDFRDYSPDTTGATDCMSALIQACSDASSSGRRLVLPAGKFLLDVSAAETNSVTLSSVADNGSGNGRITTSSAHGFTNGQSVIIMNTEYYDGAWAVSSVTSTTFDITRSYVAETFPSNAYAARGETNMAVLREAVMQGAGGFVAANGASAGDPDTGTVFYITGTGRSPIILNRGAELRDVSFWYPDQVDDLSGGPATVYPHTVVLRDALDGLQSGPGLVALKDVISYNSYHFLRAFSAGGAMGNVSFERVFAYAIRDGYDIGKHLDKFSWNKCYLGIGTYDRATDPNDNTDLASDTYKNGVAIRHKGGDGIWINDSLFYGYADGLLFDGDNDVAFAQMLGSSIDGGKRGIKVTGTGEVNRFSIVGSKFITSNSGANAEAVPQIYCDSTASPTNPAKWTISGTQFLASEGAHIQIEGSYSVDINIAGACQFFAPNNTALAATDAQRSSIHINNANASVSVTASDLVGIGGSNKIAIYAQDCSDLTVSENNIGTYNTLIKADASSVDNLVFERNTITPTGSQTYLDGTSHLKGSGYTTLVNQPSYQEDIEYHNIILDAANPIDVTFPRDVIIRNTHNLAMEDAAGTPLTVMDVTAADTLRINKKSGNTLSFVDNLSTELLTIGGGNQWNCKVPWNFEDSVDFDTYFQAYSRTDAQLTAGEAVIAGAAGVAYDSDRKSIRVSDGSNWIEPVYVCAQGGGAQSAFSSTSAPGDTYVWSSEVADPDSILASGVVTFPRKGIYDVSATVTWDFDDAGAVSGDIFQLVLLHENSGGTDIDAAKIRIENPASGQRSTTVSLITEAASTDTIKLAVRRISGTGSLKPLSGDGQLHTLIVKEIRC